MLYTASPTVSDWVPTWEMVVTMPTGPDRSRSPTTPETRSPRLIQTVRTKSRLLYQLYSSLLPRVAGMISRPTLIPRRYVVFPSSSVRAWRGISTPSRRTFSPSRSTTKSRVSPARPRKKVRLL